MGSYSVESLPEQFSIVWCLFPREGEKNKPSDVARPTLVLDVLREEEKKLGALLVAYGTGVDDDASPFLDKGPDLIIETMAAAHAIGLHKPTRFSMSPLRRRQLLWSSDYFVPRPYRADAGIVAGILNSAQIERVKECFQQRKLPPYWD